MALLPGQALAVWLRPWPPRARAWVAAGASGPRRAGRVQGVALRTAGVLDALETWVAAQDRATQIEYTARSVWRRDWPLVATGATALGLTEAQVDELFILAATL